MAGEAGRGKPTHGWLSSGLVRYGRRGKAGCGTTRLVQAWQGMAGEVSSGGLRWVTDRSGAAGEVSRVIVRCAYAC